MKNIKSKNKITTIRQAAELAIKLKKELRLWVRVKRNEEFAGIMASTYLPLDAQQILNENFLHKRRRVKIQKAKNSILIELI